MDESKKINAGKYRNKQRYKNKAKVVPKDEQKENNENDGDKIIVDDSRSFQKRSLESNWYRYESKEENDQDSSRDFSILASAPIQQASYFQFKSDKNIADVREIKQIDNKLFHLDVNMLSLSIETVPFHIRCGIDENHFTDSQLKDIVHDSEHSIINYKKYLETNRGKSDNRENDTKQAETVINARDTCATTKTLENLKGPESNDLEQWLDDILDD